MTEESHERNTESWQSGDSHRVDFASAADASDNSSASAKITAINARN